MSASGLLVPNDYYTIYCKKIVSSDVVVNDVYLYYPTNPTGQSQIISNVQPSTFYPLVYNVSAVSQSVAVQDDGSFDITESGVYWFEGSATLACTALNPALPYSMSLVIRRAGNTVFQTIPLNCVLSAQGAGFAYQSFGTAITIPKDNATPIKFVISAFASTNNANNGSSVAVHGATLSLQKIREAP